MMKNYVCLLFMVLSTACQNQAIKEPQQAQRYVDSTDGTAINYKSHGNSENQALVFIHCLGCNQSYWDKQVAAFSNDYHVITLDLAGHGESDFSREAYTITAFAEDVAALIKQFKLSMPIVVGHGLGGAVAVELASSNNTQLGRVITVNSFNAQQSWPDAGQLQDFLKPYRESYYQTLFPVVKRRFLKSTDRSLAYNMARDIARAPQETGVSYLTHYYQWMTQQAAARVQRLQTPLMHINSSPNATAAQQNSVMHMPFAGHYAPQEASGRFNQMLKKILAR